jgi:hypothetical protein
MKNHDGSRDGLADGRDGRDEWKASMTRSSPWRPGKSRRSWRLGCSHDCLLRAVSGTLMGFRVPQALLDKAADVKGQRI